MIRLKTLKQKLDNTGIKDQFIIDTDEPVVIEVINTEKGHLFANIYKAEDRSEPVGAYDSEVVQEDWAIFLNPDEAPDARRQWRLFFSDDQVADVDFLDTAGANSRVAEEGFTNYLSYEDHGDLLRHIFVEEGNTKELNLAINRVVEIKQKETE